MRWGRCVRRVDRTKVLHQLFLLICLTGGVYQMYDATTEYLGYWTRTRMTREQLDLQQMPAFGVCSPMTAEKFANATIIERLLLSKSLPKILTYCKILDSDSLKYKDCLMVTRVKEYIDSIYKCYALFEQELLIPGHRLPDYDSVSRTHKIMDINYSIPASTGSSSMLVVYPPDQSFRMKRGSHNKLWLPPDIKAEFVFTIKIEKNIVLPPPYSTQCFDFRSTKFVTRAAALDDCLIKNFVHKGKHYLPFLSFASRDNSISELFVQTINFETERSLVANAMSVCNARLGDADCESTDYSVIGITSRPGPDAQSTIRVVLSGLPSHSLRTELEPVYSLLDYFNWIGNIANLWVGAHVFGCCSFFSDLLWRRRIRVLDTSVKTLKPAKKTKGKVVRVFEWTMMLLSLVLCAYQISDIMDIYFVNPFKWNYFTKLPSDVDFPTAVFCVDRVIDEEKVRQRFPDLYNSTDPSDWDQKLTLSQQMNVTVDAEEIFLAKESFVTWRETMTWDPLLQHFKFQKYMNHRKVCFKTFSLNTRVNKSIPIRAYKRSLLEMMQYFTVTMRMDASKFTTIQVSLQFDDFFTLFGRSRLDLGNPQNIVFPVAKDQKLQVNKAMLFHREIKSFLSDDHFLSDCLEYKDVDGKTRMMLVENCVKEAVRVSMSNASANTWPRELFFSNNMHGMDMDKTNGQPLFFSTDDAFLKKVDECEAKFPVQDCSESFVELSIEDMMGKAKRRDKIMIILYPPGKGYIELRCNLRFSILGLIGFVGGSAGFWVGFAVTDMRQVIKPIASFLRKRMPSFGRRQRVLTEPSIRRTTKGRKKCKKAVDSKIRMNKDTKPGLN